ncbi:hypothetical protein D3C86_841650 [compost metagenome]
MAADAFATTANDVDHTPWQDLGQRRGQGQDRKRRVFRRLEHQGVAGGQGRGDFPRGHHDRVVPRRNRRYDTDWIAPHHAGVARQVFAAELAGLATHGTGEEAEHVDRGIEVILTGQVQRLAAVHGFEAGQQVGVFFDGVGDVQQQVRALLRRGPRPTGESAVGGEDGGFDLFGAGFGDLREDFAGGRIDDGFGTALPGD